MDKLLDTLNQYLSAAQGVLSKYAPGVWDATLQLIRAQAIFEIALSAVGLAAAVIIAWRLHVFLQGKIKKQGPYSDWEVGYLFTLFPGGLGIASIVGLLQLGNWIALFNPQLAVLYRMACKVGVL